MNLHNIAFYVHLGSLAIAAYGVLYADEVGLAWIRGRRQIISQRTLTILHEVVSVGLILLIASGVYLFWPMREYLLHQNLFYVKMALVVALVINSLVIDRMMHVATKLPFRSLPGWQKSMLFMSGGFSFVCWAGSGLTALLLFGL